MARRPGSFVPQWVQRMIRSSWKRFGLAHGKWGGKQVDWGVERHEMIWKDGMVKQNKIRWWTLVGWWMIWCDPVIQGVVVGGFKLQTSSRFFKYFCWCFECGWLLELDCIDCFMLLHIRLPIAQRAQTFVLADDLDIWNQTRPPTWHGTALQWSLASLNWPHWWRRSELDQSRIQVESCH